jgi:hypothetical protein|tara:strand:- start:781 stop:972 length:192 start_codon:yes stop_codon:yes gene_type:complete
MSVSDATVDFGYEKLHPTLEAMMHSHLTKNQLSKPQKWQYWVMVFSSPYPRFLLKNPSLAKRT